MLPAAFRIPFLAFLILLTSCSNFKDLSGNTDSEQTHSLKRVLEKPKPVTTAFRDADTTSVQIEEQLLASQPRSLFSVPRTAYGNYILSPGFYEGDFKSFCLHPGTHGPSEGDGYLYAPLKGSRKDIIETILRNSESHRSIPQKEVQLLVWAVISNANFKDLSSQLKMTASQLLTANQLYTLNGGALGLIPRDVSAQLTQRLPSSVRNIIEAENKIRNLFATGRDSYEDFERFAVNFNPAPVDHPQFRRGRWSKHPDGYFIRYYPSGYKRTKIQVFIPVADSTQKPDSTSINNISFNPFNMVAVPANTGAQRIGIGGPWEEVFGREGREPVYIPPVNIPPVNIPRRPDRNPPTQPAPVPPQTHPGLPQNEPPAQPAPSGHPGIPQSQPPAPSGHPGLPQSTPTTRPPRTAGS